MRSNPLTILIAFAVAMYATADIMTGFTGPLAATAKWLGVLIVLVSFIKPMTGLYLLSFMCFYGDFYKKLAVVYGAASMETVIEVLAVNMAIVGAIIAGTINQMLTSGPKPSRPVVMVALVSFGVTGLMMLTEGPLTGRVQMAVNGGLYLAISAVIAHYYSAVPGSSLRLSRFHFILGLPWVLVAVFQYFFGFSDMDYVYARTGLSPVYTSSFFQPEPRVFGLAGSASAYGAICFCFIFGMWSLMRQNTNRLLYGAGSLLYFIGLVVSTQRTVLLMPFIVPVVYIMFLTPERTKLLYTMLIVVVVTLIGSSNFLLSNLGEANESLASTTGDGGWAGNVLRVGTYSDRIRGWTRLLKPESYSLFGTGVSDEMLTQSDEDFAHDAINSILMNYGVLGLILALVFVSVILRTVHKAIFRTQSMENKHLMVFVTSTFSLTLWLSMIGGSNLHTVPYNLILATLLGHALAIINQQAKEPNVTPSLLGPSSVPNSEPNTVRQGGRFMPSRNASY